MDDTIQLFILCAHGLEGIVEDEVRQAPGLHPTGLAYRTVKGHCPRDSLHQLAGLRTADDAFLLLDRQDGISRVRSAATWLIASGA